MLDERLLNQDESLKRLINDHQLLQEDLSAYKIEQASKVIRRPTRIGGGKGGLARSKSRLSGDLQSIDEGSEIGHGSIGGSENGDKESKKNDKSKSAMSHNKSISRKNTPVKEEVQIVEATIESP